jgi:hypothetical protein
MEVQFISLEIKELFIDEVEVTKPRLELTLFQEAFSSLDYVPVVLKFIETGIISHEHPENVLSNVRLFALHEILNTDIVHIAISKIHLSSLIDSLQTLNIVVKFVFNVCLCQVKFWNCACMFDCLGYVLVSSSKVFVA